MADPRLHGEAATLNEQLLDRAIRHAIHLERLKSGEAQRILAFLNDKVLPDLVDRVESRLSRIGSRGFDSGAWTTGRYKDLLDGIREIVKTGMTEAASMSKSGLGEIAKAEAEWQARAIQQTMLVDVDVVTPAPSLLRSIVTQRPALGNMVREFWSDESKATIARVVDQIGIGIAQGESTSDIARRIGGTRAELYTDGVLETTRRSAEAIVRTTVNHTTTQAREDLYAENDDLVKGIMLVATLDVNTTPTCRAYDGKVFKPNEGPRPPFHWGCRTTTSPVLKSWRELGIDLKEAPAGTRASMNGQVPATLTYGDWLKRMDASKATKHFVDEALGPARAKLFRAGASVRDFVGDFGRPLTLEQIRAAEEGK